MQVASGAVNTMQRIQASDALNLLSVVAVDERSVGNDIKRIFEHPNNELCTQRTVVKQRPNMELLTDRDVSAQAACLWAKEEVTRLLARGQRDKSAKLASKYRIITPVSGAVVLENAKEYGKWQLDPGNYQPGTTTDTYRGMHQWFNGAPVDPRFGQSNEVGQLADYGYDTARDISRAATCISLLISLVIAAMFLKSRRKITGAAIAKSVGLLLLVPTLVHLVSTFMINNFGGLGGGL
jgi:hypothetical protein